MVWLTLFPMDINHVVRNVIHAITLWQVTPTWFSSAHGRKHYICHDSTYATLHIPHIANKVINKALSPTVSLKPILHNYKSPIKKNAHSCKIVKHFINECSDREMPFKYLAFVILDVVKNRSGLTRNEIENMLLEKEKYRNSPLSHNTKDWIVPMTETAQNELKEKK